MNVMVDLETLGTGNAAVIISIGAVKFDADEIHDRFHVVIDPASCQALGLSLDASTVMWWMHPDRAAARDALVARGPGIDLPTALQAFSKWYGRDSLPTWGNGATFDNVILRSAYAAAGHVYPAKFWDDQCYRTIKNRVPQIELQRIGTHHDALGDAESQAVHLQAIARHLGIAI